MEIPIVSTTVGGIPDSVAHEKSGILVEEKNPEEIAHALYKLINDEELRSKFGRYGKEFVEEKFNPVTITNQLISFYKTLIK